MFYALFAFAAQQGDWYHLADMEDSSFPQWTLTRSDDGVGSLVQAFNDSGSCGLLYLKTTGQGVTRGHTTAALPLNDPILDGESGTIYLRYFEKGNNREYLYGFSDTPITPDGNGGYSSPTKFSDFEGTIQMTPLSSTIKVRDGGSYHSLSVDGVGDAPIETGTWYEIWIVIDNATGASADQYYTYIKGGAYTTQTLLKVKAGSDVFDSALFRNGTNDPINNFFILTLNGDPENPNNGDSVYIDMIAQAPGMELSAPIGWFDDFSCGPPPPFYLVDKDGNADTGSWMGWVNVRMKPWIYSYSFDSWMFIRESDVTDTGAWGYIRK